MEKRTYRDFCEINNKRCRRLFFLQSFIPDVYYYYDDKQNCFCRKINNVEGKLTDDMVFHPKTFLWFQYKPLRYLLATYCQSGGVASV